MAGEEDPRPCRLSETPRPGRVSGSGRVPETQPSDAIPAVPALPCAPCTRGLGSEQGRQGEPWGRWSRGGTAPGKETCSVKEGAETGPRWAEGREGGGTASNIYTRTPIHSPCAPTLQQYP